MLLDLLLMEVWMAFLSLVQSTQFPCLIRVTRTCFHRQHTVKFKVVFVSVTLIVVLYKGFPQKSFAHIVISAVDG